MTVDLKFGEKPFSGTDVVKGKLWLTLLQVLDTVVSSWLLVTNLDDWVGPTKTSAYYMFDLTPHVCHS